MAGWIEENSAFNELDALLSLYPGRVEVLRDHRKEDNKLGRPKDDRPCTSHEEGHQTSNCLVFRVSVTPLFSSASPSIRVEARLPADQRDETAEKPPNGLEIPTEKRPDFKRSVSGRMWKASFEAVCLPPLDLCVVLFPDQMDIKMPEYTLSSAWLSSCQLSVLCRQLDQVWKENEGIPILMLWVDWLENNTLLLGIESAVFLSAEEDTEFSSDADPRAIPLSSSADEKVYSILKYESEEQRKRFLSGDHECGICFEVKKGEAFYQLPRCKHSFCLHCLKEYCETHVSEGTVQALNCLEEGCDSALTPDALRLVMSEAMYRRWETLTFQKALDTMGDIDWCPRCETPAIRESDHEVSHLSRCANCNFAFCTTCRECFHQGTPCTSVGDRLKEMEERVKQGNSKREMQLKLERYKQELLNSVTLKKISKPCPKCTTPIQKVSGCNKVTCTVCASIMCWVCGRKINGYDHFTAEGCALSAGEEVVDRPAYNVPEPNLEFLEMQMRLNQNPNLRRKLIRCPVCRQENLKSGMNNHLRCWACRTNFCYVCRTRIPGVVTAHFGSRLTGKCPQHSED